MLVPFTVQIPPKDRDKDLPRKLEAEHPAILRWAIDGCLQWQAMGLAPPARVTKATDDYFTDQDTLGQWLAECTEKQDPSAFIRTAALFASWKQWCEDRNHRAGSINGFSEELTDQGLTPKREAGTGHKGFEGVTLKASRV
jgi:putative DNA primase/helicase